MKARPMLFSAPMIRALIEGRKTQTRRALKRPSDLPETFEMDPYLPSSSFQDGGRKICGIIWRAPGARNGGIFQPCPYGSPGDLLWVRESWGINDYRYGGSKPIPKSRPDDLNDDHLVHFATEDDCEIQADMPARPSIHMPRWASRLTLEIADVRVERLQGITAEDAEAEGIQRDSSAFLHAGWWLYDGEKLKSGEPANITTDARASFASLWRSINGPAAWDANPWVWCLSFTVHQQNVDQILKLREAA